MVTTVFLKHPVTQQALKATALRMREEHLTTVLRTDSQKEHVMILLSLLCISLSPNHAKEKDEWMGNPQRKDVDINRVPLAWCF